MDDTGDDIGARTTVRGLTAILREDRFLQAALSNKGIDPLRTFWAYRYVTGKNACEGLLATYENELFWFSFTGPELRLTAWRRLGPDEPIDGQYDGGARLRRAIRVMIDRVGESAASKEARLVHAEAALGVRFPDDFRTDICERDGAGLDLSSGDSLQLFAIDELPGQNQIPQVETHPGLIVFGSDGSRELFGFDFRRRPPPVVMVEITSAGWEEAIEQAPTFAGFLERMEREGAAFE
jgi:SMI1 / KNR4 family (SUKH-1)